MGEKNLSNKYDIYQKILLFLLKILLIIVSLFAYKYVYNFRLNQEAGLKLLTLILITIFFVKIIHNKEIILRKNKLDLPMILFALVLLLSLFFSKSKMISFQELLLFLSYIIIFFLVTNHVENNKEFNTFIYLFFILSFLVSTYTLVQYYGLDPYLNDIRKLTSTIGQKNWISNYLAMIFPIAFSYFLLEKNKKIKSVYFLLLTILYITLLICQSRGIWISIGLTLILSIFIVIKFKLLDIFKKNKKWLVFLLVIFLIITAIYSTDNPLNKSRLTVTERAVSTFDKDDPSINTRFLIWGTTIEMIKDKPILGLGIGTFKYHYLNYQAKYLLEHPDYIKYSVNASEAHNEYLQMWVEIEVIGLSIFLIIIILIYNQFWRFFKQEKDSQKKIIAWGMVLGINCFLLHSLFTFPLHVPALASTFFVLLGLAMVYIRKYDLPEIKIKTGINHFAVKLFLNIFVIALMLVIINCLAIKPYVAELYYFTGMRYNVDKNYTKSLPNLQYAVQLDPYNGRILHALGTTYYNLNIFSKAEEILQEAKKYMIDVNTFYILGLNYSKLNMFENAEKEFKHAIYLDPKFTEVHHCLGLLYFQQGDYNGAIEQWNKILEIEPNFPNKYIVMNNLGIVYQKKEMPDEALEYFLEALVLAPEGSPLLEEIEREILNIYKSDLEN